MTRQLFDDVIGTPPPSTVDVHGLVRREKRARASRRVGYGMAAVVAVALSAGVVISTSGSTGDAPTAPQAAGSQPTRDTRFQLVADDKESAEATAKRLSQALDGAVRRAAPGTTWATYEGSTSNPTAEGLPNIVPISAGTVTYFSGTVNVTSTARQGALSLMTFPQPEPGRPSEKPATQLACAGETGCTEGRAPNGEKTVTLTTDKGNYHHHEIRIGIAGNRMLIISVSNVSQDPENAEAPPLTVAQITAIAVDVGSQIAA